jgi:SNF2 family DNA or RNA helicase
MSLLDKNAFPSVQSVSRDIVRPFVIRTEKRHAMDEKGAPLFKPRQTRMIGVEWGGHQDQRNLYEAVTHYVREGYNQALQEKKSYLGFLMILMQRLVTSSTAAIISTLEKRHAVLLNGQRLVIPSSTEEEWHDLDGQEQLDALLKMRVESARNEAVEVEALLTMARKVQAAGPDAKAMALMEWIYRLQREEGDADLKVLVFTEFVPTQQMLEGFLAERGLEVVCLHGGMTMDQREVAMRRFAGSARVLVSTDAGGEGLNLQFCHVIINFDMPWNPMRIEQRI